ncbi:alpha/beta hydrolase [Streptomyces sp. NPDC056464]|uniref:alpha/beta hydrolase n=1 Tax=Streptomyces sp. NPDC056464 TaxID=3345828 RepID=UPI003691A03A
MKQITKSAALIAAASGVVFGLVTPLTASATGTPAPLKWTDCEGDGLDQRQQCATLSVPMDYADPGGPKVDIAVSRIPSEKPSARRGALLMIPGGPGGDSLTHPSDKGKLMPQEVRDAYDLIGFAPRGNAPSTPVSCDVDSDDLSVTSRLPWPAPDGSVTENMALGRRMGEACARNGGELIKHISTLNNARDIDRIRAALGERKLSAWGVSYGTYIGAAYTELFPQRTDRIVLDSSDNPDPVEAERAWLRAFEVGVEDNFPEFAKWASRPGNPDRVAGTPAEVRSRFLALAARLDREPIPWPGAYPLTAGMPRNTLPCSAWPWRPKEAPLRVTDRGPSNVLMIQNERDVATPLSGALKLREAYGRRAVMVTMNSTGHDAYLNNGNACGDATVSHYLATGERPARDKYCK